MDHEQSKKPVFKAFPTNTRSKVKAELKTILKTNSYPTRGFYHWFWFTKQQVQNPSANVGHVHLTSIIGLITTLYRYLIPLHIPRYGNE